MPARAIGPADAWRVSPAGFARKIHELTWPAHLRLVSQVLVLMAVGRIKRLTVSLPPGHSKSTAILRTFPAWYLDLWPSHRLIGASYGASLAVDHGKFVRETIEQNSHLLRVRLKGDSTAADDWKTTMGGGMLSAGLGGSITGRRANGALMDDLHKSYDDAHSVASRESVWTSWTGTIRPRLFPNGFACVVGTRWHEEDIIGRLRGGDVDHRWVSLVLSALAEGDEEIDHVLGWNEDLQMSPICEKLRAEGIELPQWHRQSGQALWPTNVDPMTGEVAPWYDEKEIAAIRQDIGEYQFAALYQQHPSPPQGEMFPASMWDRHTDFVPPGVPMVRAWDLAATAGGGDETVGALVCRDEAGYTYVVDVVHGRWSDDQVEKVVKNTAIEDAERYGRRVRIYGEQEGGSGGKHWARRFVREILAGFNAKFEGSSGSKEVRARPLAAQQQAGFVRLVRRPGPDGTFVSPPWVDHLVEQCVDEATMIVGRDGLLAAGSVKVGDEVLTHRGRFRKVTATSRRWATERVVVKSKGLDSLVLTPEHPLYAMALPWSSPKKQSGGVRWVEAQHLDARRMRMSSRGVIEPAADAFDAVTFPVLEPDYQLVEIDLRQWYDYDRRGQIRDDGERIDCGGKSRPIAYRQALDYRFGRICGLYMAEGSYSAGRAQFSFHRWNETDLHEEVRSFMRDRLGVESSQFVPKKSENCLVIVTSLTRLEAFFRTMGHRAPTKRVPPWAWYAPLEFVEGMIDGWMAGDAGTTVSTDLVWGIRLLATRLGIWVRSTVSPVGPRPGSIQSRWPKWTVNVNPHGDVVGHVWDEQAGAVGFDVRAVDRAEPGWVVNFSIEEDESYVTTGGTVHNCRVFPNGKHDDIVDAVSMGFNELIGHGSRRARTTSVAKKKLPS